MRVNIHHHLCVCVCVCVRMQLITVCLSWTHPRNSSSFHFISFRSVPFDRWLAIVFPHYSREHSYQFVFNNKTLFIHLNEPGQSNSGYRCRRRCCSWWCYDDDDDGDGDHDDDGGDDGDVTLCAWWKFNLFKTRPESCFFLYNFIIFYFLMSQSARVLARTNCTKLLFAFAHLLIYLLLFTVFLFCYFILCFISYAMECGNVR